MNIFAIGKDSEIVSALIQSKLQIEMKNLDGLSIKEAYVEVLKTKKEDYVFYNTPIDLYLNSLIELSVPFYATREELKRFESNLANNSIAVFCLNQNPYLLPEYVTSPKYQREHEVFVNYYLITKFKHKFRYDLNQKDEVLATLLIDKIRIIKQPPLMPRPSQIQNFNYQEEEDE